MTTFRRSIGSALVAAIVFFGAAASVTAQTRTGDSFSWEGTLAEGATLEVKGVNGRIQAVPASGPTARVQARLTARRSDPDEVEIVVFEHADGVTICAVYPDGLLRSNECLPGDEGRIGARNNDVVVAFTVEVPASADFVARTSNGEVSATGIRGRVEARSANGDVIVNGGSEVVARTTNGDVSVLSDGPVTARSTNGSITAEITQLDDGSEPLSLSTTNGRVRVRLPANANATIDAANTNGGIETDFPVLVQGVVGRRRLEGVIGEGGRRIEIRTTNGRIRLERGG